MNLNIAPSPFDEDQDHNPRGFSCQLFFDSTDRDRTKIYNHHQYYPEDDCYSYHGGSPYDDDTDDKSLKLTLWSDPVKWKPSKVEPKTNVEEEDHRLALQITTGGRNKVREDQKLRPSSSLETYFSSNITSCNIIANNTPTIRVCSDCNTTKTPLWRSGPKGPKSLCNACGIRQRKARRAMAAAAAATGMAAEVDRPPPLLKIKVQQQNKQKISKIRHGQDSKFKKRSKITSATPDGSSFSSSVPKKLDFEDFLIKVGKNSSFQRVFPQDEKDAAILLMALSSGLVHG